VVNPITSSLKKEWHLKEHCTAIPRCRASIKIWVWTEEDLEAEAEWNLRSQLLQRSWENVSPFDRVKPKLPIQQSLELVN